MNASITVPSMDLLKKALEFESVAAVDLHRPSLGSMFGGLDVVVDHRMPPDMICLTLVDGSRKWWVIRDSVNPPN